MYHNRGDVYYALYPFDDKDESKVRPVIIFDTREGRSIVIKVTSHEERDNDDKDVYLNHWKKAGLREPSVARCSLFIPLEHSKIYEFLGTLDDEDLVNVLDKFYS